MVCPACEGSWLLPSQAGDHTITIITHPICDGRNHGLMVSCRFSLSGAPDFFHEISNVEPGKMARLRRGGGAGE